MAKLTSIEGIGVSIAGKLQKAGVGSTDTLLKHCRDRKGRAEIAKSTGISPSLILKFVNHADLMRIKGIGGEYSELLEASGVDTVRELARRDATKLHLAMAATNKRRRLVRQLPSQKMINAWVNKAKRMKPMVSH